MKIQNSCRLSYQLITQPEPDFLMQVDNDPEVMRFINGGKKSTAEHIEKVFIPRIAKFTQAELGWGVWKVSLLENQQAIGWVLVRPMGFFTGIANPKDLELGWRFVRDSWGQGYATEAAEHVKNQVSKVNHNTHFSAIAVQQNHASIKVMQKLGMSYVKTYLHQDPLFTDEVVLYQMPVT
ncbi:GNAT family N-acetyltransferase [Paraglaciecola aestuariivivens]